jgi:putative acyl-CoA dehydrogenase
VLLVQATLLLRDAPAFVSDAFIASRFDAEWGGVYGLLPKQADAAAIIERAWA